MGSSFLIRNTTYYFGITYLLENETLRKWFAHKCKTRFNLFKKLFQIYFSFSFPFSIKRSNITKRRETVAPGIYWRCNRTLFRIKYPAYGECTIYAIAHLSIFESSCFFWKKHNDYCSLGLQKNWICIILFIPPPNHFWCKTNENFLFPKSKRIILSHISNRPIIYS